LAKVKETQVILPVCRIPVNTSCEIVCSNDFLTAIAVPKFRGNVFEYHQFWVYVAIMSLFWISQSIAWNLQDPICFDLLGN